MDVVRKIQLTKPRPVQMVSVRRQRCNHLGVAGMLPDEGINLCWSTQPSSWKLSNNFVVVVLRCVRIYGRNVVAAGGSHVPNHKSRHCQRCTANRRSHNAPDKDLP